MSEYFKRSLPTPSLKKFYERHSTQTLLHTKANTKQSVAFPTAPIKKFFVRFLGPFHHPRNGAQKSPQRLNFDGQRKSPQPGSKMQKQHTMPHAATLSPQNMLATPSTGTTECRHTAPNIRTPGVTGGYTLSPISFSFPLLAGSLLSSPPFASPT